LPILSLRPATALCAGLLLLSIAASALAAEAPALIREVPIPPPEALGAEVPAGPPGLPVAPPANPQVGDSWLWWLFIHHPMPPHFEQHMCTVRGMSDRAYVVVQDTEWNVRITQSDVDHILARWESESIGPYPNLGIYDINVQHFGEPPDELDNDPRIYILWFDFGILSDGFFFFFDEYPDGTFPQYRSNECEVLYLNTNNNQTPSGDYMISVIAHEFEHMIHWKYDENEESWVDEGMAELAMWFYGRPDNISSFNSNPDNDLTVWNGDWADYIKTYLWSLYFYERYGAQAVWDVVHEPGNSILGYENVLDLHGHPENFEDVFADWVVANYLDDPSIGDGRWGYVGDDLPPFNDLDQTSYPVSVPYAGVSYWAADYVKFLNATSGLQIGFDGTDATSFALWALEIDAVEPTRVTRVPLDAGQIGAVTLPDVGTLYDHAVMVVGHNSSGGGTTYAYFADTGVTGVSGTPVAVAARAALEPPVPNPFNPSVTIRYTVPAEVARARLVILDASGRHVRTLLDGPLAAGESRIAWDGRSDDRGEVASGVYFFRLETGAEVATTRATLIR
jgi:hypothetical protein